PVARGRSGVPRDPRRLGTHGHADPVARGARPRAGAVRRRGGGGGLVSGIRVPRPRPGPPLSLLSPITPPPCPLPASGRGGRVADDRRARRGSQFSPLSASGRGAGGGV